ncbi:hypothetical protein DDP54_02515 [Cellulomonas sp. WB94]|uniref:DUF4097 family beta strand repeat-containing protein n=1 Tax=Cellulomonas sp. WB94 TaxID=2173174 RepID=UPI000D575D86|nr:DUF4097 family beta strand repeat-containing protein [Cellulomonas sp. WB94]PVU82065.1 hypothetical protein DDP54_02515 [Cellulomonas sp. WB94]
MPTESWVVAGPQIIEVEQVDSLRVQLVGGRVDVVVHDDPAETGARIEVHAVSGKPLEVSLADGELRVGYSFTLVGWEAFVEKFRTFRDKDSADVHIAVPRTIAVKLGTVTAEGLLAGVQHDASVSTVSGSIVTDSTRGALSANAVSGEIVVRGHTGDLTLNTVSGDVTAAGDLARVHANTVAGALVLDVSTGTSSIGATTVSGDITVRLPQGRGVNVEARSVTGRVVVDGHDYKAPMPGQTKVDLRSGEGACFVSTTSVSGHLTVLRGGGVA